MRREFGSCLSSVDPVAIAPGSDFITALICFSPKINPVATAPGSDFYLHQQDAAEKSLLPAHFSRLLYDDFKFAFIEPHSPALSADVDHDCFGYQTLLHLCAIYGTFARRLDSRVDL